MFASSGKAILTTVRVLQRSWLFLLRVQNQISNKRVSTSSAAPSARSSFIDFYSSIFGHILLLDLRAEAASPLPVRVAASVPPRLSFLLAQLGGTVFSLTAQHRMLGVSVMVSFC